MEETLFKFNEVKQKPTRHGLYRTLRGYVKCFLFWKKHHCFDLPIDQFCSSVLVLELLYLVSLISLKNQTLMFLVIASSRNRRASDKEKLKFCYTKKPMARISDQRSFGIQWF